MVADDRPSSRKERREWWRRQLAHQQSGNVPVTDFCRQLGVSITTFYYWKKRVLEVSSSLPARVVAERPSRPLASATSFVPVSLVDRRVGTHLEIELANACFVRLEGAIDPDLLQAAIAAAGQFNGSGRGVDR
jgi:hypothetical protein